MAMNRPRQRSKSRHRRHQLSNGSNLLCDAVYGLEELGPPIPWPTASGFVDQILDELVPARFGFSAGLLWEGGTAYTITARPPVPER
jgi:hypothetical protein